MAPPIIIPGKKSPAGINTPYVIIVNTYHTVPNQIKSLALIVKYGETLNKVLIEPPSVLKNKVAKGL